MLIQDDKLHGHLWITLIRQIDKEVFNIVLTQIGFKTYWFPHELNLTQTLVYGITCVRNIFYNYQWVTH